MAEIVDVRTEVDRSVQDRRSHLVRVLHFAPGFEHRWFVVLDSIFIGTDRSSRLLRQLARRHILHLGDLVGMPIARVFQGCDLSLPERRKFLNALVNFGLVPSSSSTSRPIAPSSGCFVPLNSKQAILRLVR